MRQLRETKRRPKNACGIPGHSRNFNPNLMTKMSYVDLNPPGTRYTNIQGFSEFPYD